MSLGVLVSLIWATAGIVVRLSAWPRLCLRRLMLGGASKELSAIMSAGKSKYTKQGEGSEVMDDVCIFEMMEDASCGFMCGTGAPTKDLPFFQFRCAHRPVTASYISSKVHVSTRLRVFMSSPALPQRSVMYLPSTLFIKFRTSFEG